MFYYNFATVISFVLLEIHVEILNLRIVPHVKLSRGRFTFFFFTQIKNIPRMRISAFQLIHSAKLIIFIKKIPTLLTLLIHFIISINIISIKINQRKKRKKIRNKKNKNNTFRLHSNSLHHLSLHLYNFK